MHYFCPAEPLHYMQLEILFSDKWLVAINKPHGLLVHRSPMAADATEFAVQCLRNQIGQKVFPVHRIDRKTAGVLLFALDPETNSLMQRQFMNHAVHKIYLAIVRGYCPESGTIDYPIKSEDGHLHEAITKYRRLQTVEIALPYGKFNSSRYSLLQLMPLSGRMHQLRKHMAHIRHPIIGDRPHGCNKQNKFFKDNWNHTDMLLHAYSLSFAHPWLGRKIILQAALQPSFYRMHQLLGFKQGTHLQ